MFHEYDPNAVVLMPDDTVEVTRVIVVQRSESGALQWLLQRRSATSKKNAGLYETPGGKCNTTEQAEQAEQTGLRETREENGCQAMELTGSVPFSFRNYIDEQGNVVAYKGRGMLALANSDFGTGDGEAEDIGWRSSDEVTKLVQQGQMRSDFLPLVQTVATAVRQQAPPEGSVEQLFIQESSLVIAACVTRLRLPKKNHAVSA